MQLKNKRILVTGSSGVIGRVLVDRLVQTGSQVMGIDLVPETRSANNVQYITADLAAGTPKAAIDFAPQAIFHLAASFERTTELPGYWKKVFDNDVLASHRLLEVVESLPTLRVFVFASSYLNYDPSLYLDLRQNVAQELSQNASQITSQSGKQNIPQLRSLKESDRLLPRNLVGLAKYYMDRELEFIQKTEGNFRTVSARIYRVYGRGSRDVISRWVRAALAGEVLNVFGSGNRFDYVFADDVAEGLARLAESEAAVDAVNLGSGTARSIADVLQILNSQIEGIRTRMEPDQDAIESSCADMTLFNQLTGWNPPTSLEAGIRKVVEYEKLRLGVPSR